MTREQILFLLKGILRTGDVHAYWPVTFLKDAIKLNLCTFGDTLQLWLDIAGGEYLYDGSLAKWAEAAGVTFHYACQQAHSKGFKGVELEKWELEKDA